MPRVSVIVPARDVRDYVREVLADLRRQTFTDFEVLVVDDGSDDGTPDIVRSTVEVDPRFRLLAGGGVGVGAARNLAIANASGDYLAFVDADDRIADRYLAVLVDAAEESGADLVSCGVKRLYGCRAFASGLHRRAISASVRATHLRQWPQLVWDTTVWNKLWRRDLWERAALSFDHGRWLEDLVPCVRGHVAARTVSITDQPLYYWRIRSDLTASLTDGRLVDPVSRQKSFADRMHAVFRARELLSLALAEPAVLDEFDHRILGHDIPLYLPGYSEADQDFQALIVRSVREYQQRFAVEPDYQRLGPLLHACYRAIADHDLPAVRQFLRADTRVRVDARHGPTVTVPPARRALPSTPHLPVLSRFARGLRTLRETHHRFPDHAEALTTAARVDRCAPDPDRPGRWRLRGVARVLLGRTDVSGPWQVECLLEGCDDRDEVVRRTVVGPLDPLAPAPDGALHPFLRSGWRPFSTSLTLAELPAASTVRYWRLSLRLRAARTTAVAAGVLTAAARRRLPPGWRRPDDTCVTAQVGPRHELRVRVTPAADDRLVGPSPARSPERGADLAAGAATRAGAGAGQVDLSWLAAAEHHLLLGGAWPAAAPTGAYLSASCRWSDEPWRCPVQHPRPGEWCAVLDRSEWDPREVPGGRWWRLYLTDARGDRRRLRIALAHRPTLPLEQLLGGGKAVLEVAADGGALLWLGPAGDPVAEAPHRWLNLAKLRQPRSGTGDHPAGRRR